MYCRLEGVQGLNWAISDADVSLVDVDFIRSSNSCLILSKLLSSFPGSMMLVWEGIEWLLSLNSRISMLSTTWNSFLLKAPLRKLPSGVQTAEMSSSSFFPVLMFLSVPNTSSIESMATLEWTWGVAVFFVPDYEPNLSSMGSSGWGSSGCCWMKELSMKVRYIHSESAGTQQKMSLSSNLKQSPIRVTQSPNSSASSPKIDSIEVGFVSILLKTWMNMASSSGYRFTMVSQLTAISPAPSACRNSARTFLDCASVSISSRSQPESIKALPNPIRNPGLKTRLLKCCSTPLDWQSSSSKQILSS